MQNCTFLSNRILRAAKKICSGEHPLGAGEGYGSFRICRYYLKKKLYAVGCPIMNITLKMVTSLRTYAITWDAYDRIENKGTTVYEHITCQSFPHGCPAVIFLQT